ncbi:hypothetical protein [Fischerella sp. PCC 9605]|uniref:hypothetical protein n=1 Tax=Fischerella sp. PCC 9605 TaxID=1173024 RepID=UPI0004B39E99|nr:hypothetical protein [Fischerella sp. PCC 9605]
MKSISAIASPTHFYWQTARVEWRTNLSMKSKMSGELLLPVSCDQAAKETV